jgi:hypothetical protein
MKSKSISIISVIQIILLSYTLCQNSMEHRPDRYNFSLNLTKLNEIFANGVVDDSLINDFFSNSNFLLTDNNNNNDQDAVASLQSDQKSSPTINNNAEIDFNHIIIFNIGNNDSYENPSHSYKLKFDQDKINYCNFDPKYLSNKRKVKSIDKLDNQQVKKPDFNLNIFLKGQTFNESSQITGLFYK